MSISREMQEKVEQHSSEQREENNVLLRSIAGMVKVVGGIVCAMLFTCICVGVADHYKLIAVGELVAKLTASTDKVMIDANARNLADAAWHSNIDNAVLNQKAEVLALTNRLALLESEVRQTKKP